jgi:hypothetical protein
MKPVSIVVLLLCLGVPTSVALAQRTDCSCVSADTSCKGNASCQGGCTAFCGTKSLCFAGCKIDWIYEQRSFKFSQKTGKEIIASITPKSNKGSAMKALEFIPKKGEEDLKFDLDLKEDSLWRLLDYLSKHGTVKVKGTDFEKIKQLRDYMTRGQLSIKLNQVTVKYAAAELSFLTGEALRVRRADAKKRVTLSVENATLHDVLQRIREKTGVEVSSRETAHPAVSRQAK